MTAATLSLANVLCEKSNGIARVIINHPKVLNALDTPTGKRMKRLHGRKRRALIPRFSIRYPTARTACAAYRSAIS